MKFLSGLVVLVWWVQYTQLSHKLGASSLQSNYANIEISDSEK